MGHERIGILPRTQPWEKLVRQVTEFSGAAADAPAIAANTLGNVRSRFAAIQQDSGMKAAFKFLVALSVSADPARAKEAPYGLAISSALSPLALAKLLHSWVTDNQDSLEYGQLAQAAAADAIANWHEQHSSQRPLFASEEERGDTWRKAGTGAGFCELARLFFAGFLGRYLNYFLERQASVSCRTIADRDLLSSQVRNHVEAVSRHAFETAKIAQSFAAGWYNRHAAETLPSDAEVESFLSVAFGKIREELRREGST